jgi:hypothetical protein
MTPAARAAGLFVAAGSLSAAGCVFFQRPPGPGVTPGGAPQAPAPPARFENVTKEAGVTFRHDNGRFGKKLFPEIMGSGAAWLDADGDGFLDLYLVNSQTLEGAPTPRRPLSRFYHNRGDGTFEDRTERSGLGHVGFGMGAAVGDVNNDGHPDLFVTALGPSHLFLNRGDGTFRDVTPDSGVKNDAFASSAAFVDYDNDGLLDLYVCNYVTLPDPIDEIVCRTPSLARQYCDVHLYQGSHDRLFHNLGRGKFEDVSRRAGIDRLKTPYRGLAILCSDYDRDGRVDIFVANDEHPMLLWRNEGGGRFHESGGEAGVAYDEAGRVVAGMGLDMADLDGDGFPELYESNFQGRANPMFQMQKGGWFVDRTTRMGLANPTMDRLSFGVAFLDYDLDGWVDLAVANGHVIDNIQETQKEISYRQESQLFRNEGQGRFVDTSRNLGGYGEEKHVGRGCLVADYDNDGDPDLLYTNNDDAPALLRNLATNGETKRTWLGIRCMDAKGARDVYNALVEIQVGGRALKAETHAAAGYLGSNDPRVLFGLAGARRVDRVSVVWPGGHKEEFGPQDVNRYVVVRQGSGAAVSG